MRRRHPRYVHPRPPARFFLRDAAGSVFCYDGVNEIAQALIEAFAPSKPLWTVVEGVRTQTNSNNLVIRDANGDLAEIGFNARQTGRLRRPPVAWDEIPRHHERSWKRSRGKQWRR